MKVSSWDWCALRDDPRGREIGRYIISGVSVTAVNFGLFWLLDHLGLSYLWANASAIVAAKITAYVLNKWYVFRCQTHTLAQTCSELLRYILVRGSTGLLDFFGLMVWVELLGWPRLPGKIVVMGIVLVLNYLLGKNVVFVSKKKAKNDNDLQ